MQLASEATIGIAMKAAMMAGTMAAMRAAMRVAMKPAPSTSPAAAPMLAPAMGNDDDKRGQRLQLLEDHIGRALRQSEASGELRAAPSWGKPLAHAEGYDETPPELRLGYKILKDAGLMPPEVEMLRTLAGLKNELDAAAGDAARSDKLRGRIAALRLAIELRRDAMRNDARRAKTRG